MATANENDTSEAVAEARLALNSTLIQSIDKKVSNWLEQKDPSFNAAVLIAIMAVEDFIKEAKELKVSSRQKHNLAVDAIGTVIGTFARYRPEFIDRLQEFQNKLSDQKQVDELIHTLVAVSVEPNVVNARWKPKKQRKASCFGK